MFADMSDTVAREIVWAFAAFIFALIQIWLGKTIHANQIDNDTKLAGLATIAADTHTLVNDRHGKALKLAMDLAQALADARNTPEASEVAAQARKDYEDHQAKQAAVDSEAERRALEKT